MMITDDQIKELRRETFAAYERGESMITGVRVNEQLQVETAALQSDGGILGLAGYHARRITQVDARKRCSAVYAQRRGAR